METLAILFGFWLALAAVYGGVSGYSAYQRRRQQRQQKASIRSGAFTARASTDQPVLGSLFSEVDMLRAEVETLRSEMSALHGGSHIEKARLRRYRSGAYTELPRSLRRQVREVRNFRHAVSV